MYNEHVKGKKKKKCKAKKKSAIQMYGAKQR